MDRKCNKCSCNFGLLELSDTKTYKLLGDLLHLDVSVRHYPENYNLCDTCFDDIILSAAEGIKKGRA